MPDHDACCLFGFRDGSHSPGCTDAWRQKTLWWGNGHLLCSNYWIQPIYQELLHSSSRYNATRAGERNRPSSGLARVAAHPRPPKKRKPSASGTRVCDWIGGICYADTLQVWFPAHWAPVALQQLQHKEDPPLLDGPYPSGTPTLRSFIYDDVGEPTSHPCSLLKWLRATTYLLCKYLSHLGHLYVEFAMASRSSTERLGDFWKRWVSRSCLGVFLCCLLFVFCLCCLVFHWHLAFLFTYSPTCGNSQSKTKRFYDRLSFERARHGHKKKPLLDGPGGSSGNIRKQWQEARANRRMQFKVGNSRDGDRESNIRMLTGTIKADWIQLPWDKVSLLGCLGTKEPHLGPSRGLRSCSSRSFFNDLSLDDWYAGVYALPTVWPDVSMLGAANLRKVAGYDFHLLRKKYDVLSMWGNLHPQWRLLKNQLETKGPGWYSLAEREARLFTNRSNRPGDDMKDELRSDGDPIVWQAWRTTQNQLWQLRQPGPPLEFPGEQGIFIDMYAQVREEEQVISPQFTRNQEDVSMGRRKKRKQVEEGALAG